MKAEPRRQVLQPPPANDAGDPVLIGLLSEEISQAGPISFAGFMQRSLYEPNLGYYATSAERPGRKGDFLTAPELHPIFGRTLARGLHEQWQRLGEPANFTLREYGAGGGRLVLSLLEGLQRMRSGLIEGLRYQPVDLPAQRGALEQVLHDAGWERLLAPAEGSFVGCVLANEYIDALPVHRVVWRGGRLHELFVGWAEGRFVELEDEPSTSALADWFSEAGIELAEGQRAEVNLAMFDWLAQVAADLERGYVVIFDYGARPAELYGAARFDGTLRAFREQHVSSDVLSGVGRQDLTAHVDLAALERGAHAVGLDFLGQTTQAEFLLGCGLEEVLAAEREAAAASWHGLLSLRSAAARLLDPRVLGGYAAVVLGRAVAAEPALSGLSHRLPSRS